MPEPGHAQDPSGTSLPERDPAPPPGAVARRGRQRSRECGWPENPTQSCHAGTETRCRRCNSRETCPKPARGKHEPSLTDTCGRLSPERRRAVVPYPSWLNAGDTSWQLTAATLVGLMSLPGLAVLYGGLVQRK